MTELRKQANRVTFGVAEEEAFYGEETEGLGRLTGREQFSGSVRTATVDTRNKRTPRPGRTHRPACVHAFTRSLGCLGRLGVAEVAVQPT